MAVEIGYDEFVVVAEQEVKFGSEKPDDVLHVSISLADMDWECTRRNQYKIDLDRKDVMEADEHEMQIEVLLYGRTKGQIHYERLENTCRFNAHQKHWEYLPYIHYHEYLLTLRVLRKRSEFPTFTVSDDVPGSNRMVKLKVGSRVFHVDKQLLSTFSPYFDRMFNGDFVESKSEEEIELKAAELADPDIFHDFLLTTLLSGDNNVLPNTHNVASLLKVAKFCQVDILRKKCERHLKLCREMPLKERILLCKEHGFKNVRAHIMRDISFEQCKQLLNVLLDEEKI